MSKIHNELFIVRDFIIDTIERMEQFSCNSKDLTTYNEFNESFIEHKFVLSTLLSELINVTPLEFGFKKVNTIGHVMYCYYQTCQSENVISALDYAMNFNGYCDNLLCIKRHIDKKSMATCKFSKKNTVFKKAYYPTIKHCKPTKNTYNLNKHLLITGPNAAGKTTILKTTLLNILLCQQIGIGYFKSASIYPYDNIHCYINIPDTSGRDSLFQAEARRCKNILESIESTSTSERHFCVFDELYSGTNPYEAIASAIAFLKYMNRKQNISYIITTHFLDLCKKMDDDRRWMMMKEDDG